MRLDLEGKKFRNLLVQDINHINARGFVMWNCLCDCGNRIIVRSSALKYGHTVSCGCLQSRKTDITGEVFGYLIAIEVGGHDNHRNRKWLCKCKCGNTVLVSTSSLISGHTQSCGCYNKEILSKNSGKNHYNWNHDITDAERKENEKRCRSNKTKVWRKKVMKRDNYTCQVCGKYNGKLAAHHIYSYHSHKSLRYTTSNGVTLCTTCHKKFHKEFGIKYNTRRQFNKFKKNMKIF